MLRVSFKILDALDEILTIAKNRMMDTIKPIMDAIPIPGIFYPFFLRINNEGPKRLHFLVFRGLKATGKLIGHNFKRDTRV